MLLGIAIVAATLGIALAAAVTFVVMSLSRGARLIALRTGRGRIDLVVRQSISMRSRRARVPPPRRMAPQFAFSRDVAR